MDYYNRITNEYVSALKNNYIRPKFKIELMDYEENVLSDITQYISRDSSGNLSINYQQGVRRSCSLTLLNLNGELTPNFNSDIWINTKFKLYFGIETKKLTAQNNDLFVKYAGIIDTPPDIVDLLYENDEDNQLIYSNSTHFTEDSDTYWFSQGIFIITNPSVLRELSRKTITLNGVDKFGIFGSETNFTETEGTYVVNQGTKVSKVIQDILNLPLTSTIKLDNKPLLINQEVGEETLPYDIKKSPNSHLSDILIELGNIFACDIFYDTDGYLNVTKGEEQNFSDYPAIWDFDDTHNEYSNPNLNLDFVGVYNTVKVVGTNPNISINIEETVVNNNYDSPTRVELIGSKIKYVESSFCYNSDRAKDYAMYLLRKYSIIQSAFNFQSSFIPHLDVNQVIGITDSYYNFNGERFLIQSLNMPISTQSVFDVQATNVTNIPYFDLTSGT